ncbi:unnamed protein product, partial [Ectocarpus sp. 4 AP-2014]
MIETNGTFVRARVTLLLRCPLLLLLPPWHSPPCCLFFRVSSAAVCRHCSAVQLWSITSIGGSGVIAGLPRRLGGLFHLHHIAAAVAAAAAASGLFPLRGCNTVEHEEVPTRGAAVRWKRYRRGRRR